MHVHVCMQDACWLCVRYLATRRSDFGVWFREFIHSCDVICEGAVASAGECACVRAGASRSIRVVLIVDMYRQQQHQALELVASPFDACKTFVCVSSERPRYFYKYLEIAELKN